MLHVVFFYWPILAFCGGTLQISTAELTLLPVMKMAPLCQWRGPSKCHQGMSAVAPLSAFSYFPLLVLELPPTGVWFFILREELGTTHILLHYRVS